MEIRLNKSALTDLSKIFDIIYRDKPSVAREYVTKIQTYIHLLETNPKMGKECKYKNIQHECRVIYYDNYRIIYKIVNDELIRILKINNTKQNNKGKK